MLWRPPAYSLLIEIRPLRNQMIITGARGLPSKTLSSISQLLRKTDVVQGALSQCSTTSISKQFTAAQDQRLNVVIVWLGNEIVAYLI